MIEKNELRARMKKKRASLSETRRKEASERICRAIWESDVYRKAPAVLLYAALSEEIDLSLLEGFCREDGKQTLYPRCGKAGEMTFFFAAETELSAGRYGIREPNGDCEPCVSPPENALCIVPGLCFDENGHRLGYGGGYYDRYLASHPLVTVGVCFDELLVPALPTEETDIPVSRVITG